MTFVMMIFSILLLPPASAHAEMNHGAVAHHEMAHQDSDKQIGAETALQTHECASMIAANQDTNDNSSVCCSGICVAGFLSDKHDATSPKVEYLHRSADGPGLVSMITEGLLRPPSI